MAALDPETHPGRSQTWLARTLGVSQPSVSAWVRGRSRPDETWRAVLESLLGIPADAWRTDAERERIRAATSTSPEAA